ncbi:MAG TPA: hypothetical protein VKF40_11770 [Burkholderiales bacterium]|nr:hypothetical protein [Burkholderiales bacterium]
MQPVEARSEMLKQYGGEPAHPLIVLLKCAAGLLTLVAVAAGPWVLISSDAVVIAAEQPAFQLARSFLSAEESKRIFEERRQHYKDASPRTEGRPPAGPPRKPE